MGCLRTTQGTNIPVMVLDALTRLVCASACTASERRRVSRALWPFRITADQEGPLADGNGRKLAVEIRRGRDWWRLRGGCTRKSVIGQRHVAALQTVANQLRPALPAPCWAIGTALRGALRGIAAHIPTTFEAGRIIWRLAATSRDFGPRRATITQKSRGRTAHQRCSHACGASGSTEPTETSRSAKPGFYQQSRWPERLLGLCVSRRAGTSASSVGNKLRTISRVSSDRGSSRRVHPRGLSAS